MIALNFGLWWSGSKLSYLRYLTFKSLRHFHPHSRIRLYMNDQFNNQGAGSSQEYTNPDKVTEDYLPKLEELGVEIIKVKYFSEYSPNHQSDWFRWWFLKYEGGFYLDTDQIILKSFKTLPLRKNSFIYSCYDIKSSFAQSGKFAPVGVLGATTNSKTVDYIYKILEIYYDPMNYNCLGPLMFLDLVNKGKIKGFNAPSSYFYPAAICDKTDKYFNGRAEFTEDNLSFHWFGGFDLSQRFNRAYTEEFSKTSNDTISRFLRKEKII